MKYTLSVHYINGQAVDYYFPDVVKALAWLGQKKDVQSVKLFRYGQ